MAPFEAIYGATQETYDDYLSWQMIKLPFECLHPGSNADEWGGKQNVYGKKLLLEDTGVPKIEKGPVKVDEESKQAARARITVILTELNKSSSIRADSRGRAHFVITENIARLSQEGKGLTIRLRVVYGKKQTTKEVKIDPDTLAEIYENLMMG